MFDFDDTIWARVNSDRNEKLSIENIKLINDYLADKAVIVSGNSYSSIKNKLIKVYGNNLERVKVDIWADANSSLFRQDKLVDFMDKFVIDARAKTYVDQIANDYGLTIEEVGYKPVNYKIKPLSTLERKLLVDLMKTKYKNVFKADMTGKTTVDILSLNNSKQGVFEHCNFGKLNTLYIGDELKAGNDAAIAKCCTDTIEVKDVAETNTIIKLLIEEMK